MRTADLRYARRSDNERSACYRSGRLAGLEAMEAEMEVIVQVWVYSHGEGGGFALNEAADALADAARQGDFVEGVRVAVPPNAVPGGTMRLDQPPRLGIDELRNGSAKESFAIGDVV